MNYVRSDLTAYIFLYIFGMSISATEFRKNLYQLLESAVVSGNPLRVKLKSHTFIVSPEQPVSKLARLKPQELIHGADEDLLNLDWSSQWSEKHI